MVKECVFLVIYENFLIPQDQWIYPKLNLKCETTFNFRLYGEAEFWREIKFPNLMIINEYEVSLQVQILALCSNL